MGWVVIVSCVKILGKKSGVRSVEPMYQNQQNLIKCALTAIRISQSLNFMWGSTGQGESRAVASLAKRRSHVLGDGITLIKLES